MSVFLLNPDNEVIIDSPSDNDSGNGQNLTDASQALLNFWPQMTEEIRQIENMDVRCQALPLARIKKIMKLDEDVKMISAEAPVLFAKAAELFIQELTLRSWVHTEDNKRRTLQRNDIAMAITKYDQFDFLIDIVPREEARPGGRAPVSLDQVQYYLQLNQGGGQQAQDEEEEERPAALQLLQQQMTVAEGKPVTTSGGIQVLQQIVGPNGEVQHVPVQVPDHAMELIRVQGASGTPIMLSHPQLIQVRQQNPVFAQAPNPPQN